MTEKEDTLDISFAMKSGIQKYCMGPVLDLARGYLKADDETFHKFEKLAKKAVYNGIRLINEAYVQSNGKFTVSATDKLLPKTNGKPDKQLKHYCSCTG